jgi:hypothetical protein
MPDAQPMNRRGRSPRANIAAHTAGAISRMKTRSTPAMRTEEVMTMAKER